jgi:hypothetical protein
VEEGQSKPGRVGRAVFRNPVMVVPTMGGSALVLLLAIAGLPVAKSGAVIGAVVFSVVLGFVVDSGLNVQLADGRKIAIFSYGGSWPEP